MGLSTLTRSRIFPADLGIKNDVRKIQQVHRMLSKKKNKLWGGECEGSTHEERLKTVYKHGETPAQTAGHSLLSEIKLNLFIAIRKVVMQHKLESNCGSMFD